MTIGMMQRVIMVNIFFKVLNEPMVIFPISLCFLCCLCPRHFVHCYMIVLAHPPLFWFKFKFCEHQNSYSIINGLIALFYPPTEQHFGSGLIKRTAFYLSILEEKFLKPFKVICVVGVYIYALMPFPYPGYRFGEILDGRYEVTAAHGKGVFSTVVRAKNLKAANGEPEEVAIKIIRSNDTM